MRPVLLVGLSRCDNPARVQRADRAAARFVPRLNGAGTPRAASAPLSNNFGMHGRGPVCVAKNVWTLYIHCHASPFLLCSACLPRLFSGAGNGAG